MEVIIARKLMSLAAVTGTSVWVLKQWTSCTLCRCSLQPNQWHTFWTCLLVIINHYSSSWLMAGVHEFLDLHIIIRYFLTFHDDSSTYANAATILLSIEASRIGQSRGKHGFNYIYVYIYIIYIYIYIMYVYIYIYIYMYLQCIYIYIYTYISTHDVTTCWEGSIHIWYAYVMYMYYVHILYMYVYIYIYRYVYIIHILCRYSLHINILYTYIYIYT